MDETSSLALDTCIPSSGNQSGEALEASLEQLPTNVSDSFPRRGNLANPKITGPVKLPVFDQTSDMNNPALPLSFRSSMF